MSRAREGRTTTPDSGDELAVELAAALAEHDETREQFEVNSAGGDVDPEQHVAAVAACLAPKAEALLGLADGPCLPGSARLIIGHWHGRSEYWWKRLAASLADLHATLQDLASGHDPATSGGRGPGRPPEPFLPFVVSVSRILAERRRRGVVMATALLFAALDLVEDDLRQDHADGRCIRFNVLSVRVAGARKASRRCTRASPQLPSQAGGEESQRPAE